MSYKNFPLAIFWCFVAVVALTRGIWGRGWGRKKFDPPNLPRRGSWGPKIFFPWGSTKSLLYCQILRRCDKNWGFGGRGTLLVFFQKATCNTEVDSEHALETIIVGISSYRGRNLIKNWRTEFWISSPFWRYGFPNFTKFFVNFFQKIHVGLVWRRQGLGLICVHNLLGKCHLIA